MKPPTYYRFVNSEGRHIELRGDMTIEDIVRMNIGFDRFCLVPKGTKPKTPNEFVSVTLKSGGKMLRGYTGDCPKCGNSVTRRTPDGRTKSVNETCTTCGRTFRLLRNKALDRKLKN